MKIIRKRIIPLEEVDISSDELLFKDENVIITRWFPIKPRSDVGWGVSLLDLNENFKVSAFYDKKGNFIYWYCDIISVSYDEDLDTFIIKDLLVDVKMYPGKKPEILDIDELETAFLNGLINEDEYYLATEASVKVFSLLNEDIPIKFKSILKYGPPLGFNPV